MGPSKYTYLEAPSQVSCAKKDESPQYKRIEVSNKK